MMTKHVRQIFADAIRAAAPYDISVRMTSGGKHQKLILEGRGTHRPLAVPCSPRDADDAVHIARQHVRRLLREMVHG